MKIRRFAHNGLHSRTIFLFAATCLAVSVLFVVSVEAQTTTALGRARKLTNRRELPTAAFYETNTLLPAAKPGTLIRREAFDDYDLSANMSALRILYHSRSASGQDVAVSAVALIPAGKPPAGGWPVIAWAHGFSGVSRRCAPSLMRNILNGPFLSMYLSLGYAVVATDYAGLGTYSRYAALDAESNAEDVLYSVVAAHAATPLLSAKWIAMGESQGAMTAIKVAELPESDDPNYLGSVAISGVANPEVIYKNLATSSDGMLAILAYGVKTVFPEFKPADIFTDEGLTTFERVESTCGTPGNTGGSSAAILKPHWEKNRLLQEFLLRNEVGHKTAHGPLLVIVGELEPAITASMTAQVVRQMCQQHDHVDFEQYPEVNAGSVLGVSVRDQINWIQARFAGRIGTSNCER